MPPINTNVSKTGSSASGGNRLSGTSSKSVSSGSANSSFQFEKGQVFRGEVIDLRNHETKILLDDARTISARLDKHMDLSIGQRAAFQVTEASKSGISLKIVSNQARHMIDNTIDKALDEAGLPKLSHNIEAVKELLNNQLSIDKNTIYRLLQHAAAFKDVSMATLAQMMKYNLPITEVNAVQLEAYRNYEHRLLPQLSILTDSLNAALANENNSFRSSLTLNQTLLSILSDSERGCYEGLIPAGTNEQILELADLLESSAPKLCVPILNGTASLRDTAHAIISAAALSYKEQETVPAVLVQNPIDPAAADLAPDDTAGQKMPDVAQLLVHPTPLSLPDGFSTPLVIEILECFASQQLQNGELASFLTAGERNTLSEKLSFLPLPESVHEMVQSGDINGRKLLAEIRHSLLELASGSQGKVSSDDLKALLTSKEYHSLLQGELIRHWTLTPKDLQKGFGPQQFYEQLEQELSRLTSMADHSGSSHSSRQFGQDAQNIRGNIDFMKTLNNIFSYVQLPLQLSGKNIHSELYVYTKKESLRKDKQSISVLLHLDMEELGPLDVRINLDHLNVTAKFYVEGSPVIRMIEDHLPSLENALNQKGYSLLTEVHLNEQKTDIVKDFIAPDVPVGNMKRYTFDIRA